MVITKVNAVSCAKIGAVLYAGIGLIVGGMFSLLAMAGGFAGMLNEAPGAGIVGLVFGAGAIIIAPIVYGILGFIGVLIGALLFNLAAGITGGVEIEVRP